jgi:hypothetical protein
VPAVASSPIPPVLDQLRDQPDAAEHELPGLLARLAKAPDPRKPRVLRHVVARGRRGDGSRRGCPRGFFGISGGGQTGCPGRGASGGAPNHALLVGVPVAFGVEAVEVGQGLVAGAEIDDEAGTRLFLEIQARGYRGSRQVVRKHLAALRAGTAEPVRVDIPSPRKITSWIMRPRETLTESPDERLLQVRLACPDITRACDLARTFADLVGHRRGYLLQEWIRQAEQDAPKPMKGFAGFLRQYLDAVTAGLTLPWSSGVVEGHVNRVKTLKRAMYGRASFELLRTRIVGNGP